MSKKLFFFTVLILIAFTIAAYFVILPGRKNETKPVIPHVGQIQVLNACGTAGAAQKVGSFLRGKGFDVVEIENHDEWYFKHTIVACRNGNMPIAEQVAKALGTERLMLLRQKGALLDATVYVGRDIKKLVKAYEQI